MRALPLPAGVHNVNVYLIVSDPDALLAFIEAALGGTVGYRSTFEGKTRHAEVRVGDATIMVGGMPGQADDTAMLYVYVDDCDAAYARAIAAGAESIMEPADMFYGDRHGGVRDRFGNTWWIATHIEDVPPDELGRRAQAEYQRRAAANG